MTSKVSVNERLHECYTNGDIFCKMQKRKKKKRKKKRGNDNFKLGTGKSNRLRIILAEEENHHNPGSRNIPNPKCKSGVKNAKLCVMSDRFNRT